MGEVRVYPIVWHERDGHEWYECPVCGTLTPDEARLHGLAHVIPVEQLSDRGGNDT